MAISNRLDHRAWHFLTSWGTLEGRGRVHLTRSYSGKSDKKEVTRRVSRAPSKYIPSVQESSFRGNQEESTRTSMQSIIEFPSEKNGQLKATREPLKGVRMIPAMQALAVGLALKFIVPIPSGVTEQGWSLLSIFITTVLGLVLNPLPVGAWAFLSITACVGTGTLTFSEAFGATNNEVIWLIVVSFMFARGIEKTGLGGRLANLLIEKFGHSTLGLSIGLNVAESILAPAMPSTSARAGGIFVPIIKSLSESSGSFSGDETRKKMGSFLMQSQLQNSMHTSCMFITAAAQNLLCIDMASNLGVHISDPFLTWTMGAALPSLTGIFGTTAIVYTLMRPEETETPQAPTLASERLGAMGPVSSEEQLVLAILGFTVILWVLGPSFGISAVKAAIMGLSLLLVTGVISWKECLGQASAWDTFVWFSALIGMSSQLNSLGVISALTGVVGGVLTSLSIGWLPLFWLLHVVFFTLHYGFASQAAHVGALYAAFLSMMLTAGVPPVLAAMSLAYSVNLFGSLTHYASGQAAAYYGSGFMRIEEVFFIGAINGYFSLLLYAALGMPVWKMMGWW